MKDEIEVRIAREIQRVLAHTGQCAEWLFIGAAELVQLEALFGSLRGMTFMGCRVMEVDASTFLRAAP